MDVVQLVMVLVVLVLVLVVLVVLVIISSFILKKLSSSHTESEIFRDGRPNASFHLAIGTEARCR